MKRFNWDELDQGRLLLPHVNKTGIYHIEFIHILIYIPCYKVHSHIVNKGYVDSPVQMGMGCYDIEALFPEIIPSFPSYQVHAVFSAKSFLFINPFFTHKDIVNIKAPAKAPVRGKMQ